MIPNNLLFTLISLRVQMLWHITRHPHLASITAKRRVANSANVVYQGTLQRLPVVSRRVLTVDWDVTITGLVARCTILATCVIHCCLLDFDDLALFEVPFGRVDNPRVTNHCASGYL